MVQRPRHSQDLQGSEGLRKGPDGAEKRPQAAPPRGGETPSSATGLGHSPNAKAAAEAPAAPDNRPNSAWDPEEAPVATCHRPKNCFRGTPLSRSRGGRFRSHWLDTSGRGTRYVHAQYGPMRRGEILPASWLTVEAEKRRRSNCCSLFAARRVRRGSVCPDATVEMRRREPVSCPPTNEPRSLWTYCDPGTLLKSLCVLFIFTLMR